MTFDPIPPEVVDRRLRSVNVSILRCKNGPQFVPAKGASRVVGLGKNRRTLLRTFMFGDAGQRMALETLGKAARNPAQFGNRGGKVHKPRRLCNDGRSGRWSRHFGDEGNVQHCGIDEKPMLRLSVHPQRLPVVAGKHDEDAVIKFQLLQAREEASKLRVVECDFTVIKVVGMTTGGGFWWTIRAVRIVEVQPQEERPAGLKIQPGKGAVRGSVARRSAKEGLSLAPCPWSIPSS